MTRAFLTRPAAARLAALVGIVLAMLVCSESRSHEIRPVFLDVEETLPGRYDVTFKKPNFNGVPIPVSPSFDARCVVEAGGEPRSFGGFSVSRLKLRCAEGLAGTDIVFEGLTGTMVDGLVRIRFASGEVVTGRVHPDAHIFQAPASSSAWDVFRLYVWIGVEHILLGFDHLLFVFALVLFVKDWRRLVLTATAFTLAHSITLSMSALGVIRLPVAPIEALIALSILMLAVELVRSSDAPERSGGRRPATLAFVFGLLHGLGFASALAEIGLPQHEVPLALLAFNLGVEAGQIAFIAALLGLGWLGRRLAPTKRRVAFMASAYGVGSLAAFWTLERVLGF